MVKSALSSHWGFTRISAWSSAYSNPSSAGRGQPEVDVEFVGSAQEGDVPVPQRDQVLGGQRRDVEVVHPDGLHLRQQAAQRHQRLLHGLELVQLRCGELERDGDDRIEALAHQQVLEDRVAVPLLAAGVVQGQVVAALVELLGGALEHVGVVPAGDRRHDHADVAAAPGGQRRRVVGQHVAQLLGGQVHGVPRGRGDLAVARERAGDGCHRNAGALGHVLNAGHLRASPLLLACLWSCCLSYGLSCPGHGAGRSGGQEPCRRIGIQQQPRGIDGGGGTGLQHGAFRQRERRVPQVHDDQEAAVGEPKHLRGFGVH